MLKLPRYRLQELLRRDSNNLDFIRLICSCLVIFGHAFVVINDPAYPFGTWDPSSRLHYEGVYSASVAVKVFFFISGLLVTNSLLEKKSVTGFMCGRFFRIWPAYMAVLAISAFIVGPCFTVMRAPQYFLQREVYVYPVYNFLMLSMNNLPGVFLDNPLPRLVNGALWSLPYEVTAYLILLLLFLLGVHRSLLISSGLVLLVVIGPLSPAYVLLPWYDPNPQFTFLPPCFAIGAYLALVKRHITIGWETVAALVMAFVLLKSTDWGPLFFFVTVFVTLLYLSGTRWMCALRLPFDCSYGTFLWGFVIQQCVAAKFADKGLVFNLVFSLAASLAVGCLSWYWVEKPAIALGHRLAGRLKTKLTPKEVASGEYVL